MKVALAIHLLMLSLAGSLAWHAGGSSFLWVGSMVVVLVYALLSIRPEPLAEPVKLTTSALLVIFTLHRTTDQSLLWLCLLALPQLLSATQCIWEIRNAGAVEGVDSIQLRRAVFTLGFYATLGLAFMLLRDDLINVDALTGRMLAVVSSLLGFIAWEASRAGRLKEGKTASLTGRGFSVRIALISSGTVMFVPSAVE